MIWASAQTRSTIDDASACTLLFRSGAVATIVSTDLAPRGYSTIGLHLLSRDLAIEIPDWLAPALL